MNMDALTSTLRLRPNSSYLLIGLGLVMACSGETSEPSASEEGDGSGGVTASIGGEAAQSSSGGRTGTGGETAVSAGGTKAEAFCYPGATQACLGPAACSGAQVCARDGALWGTCDCGDVEGSGGTGGQSTGGAGGESTGGTGGERPVIGRVPADFVAGGLGESGDWRGYAFTAVDEAGSSILPSEFVGSELCAEGVLAPGFGSWAVVGWNIAQEVDPETLEGGNLGEITPGGTGLDYEVVNLSDSAMMIQLAPQDSGESWCALIDESMGSISWSDFRQQCWSLDPGPVYQPAYDKIAQIFVVVRGESASASAPFEFCVVHLSSAD